MAIDDNIRLKIPSFFHNLSTLFLCTPSWAEIKVTKQISARHHLIENHLCGLLLSGAVICYTRASICLLYCEAEFLKQELSFVYFNQGQ